jgi:hypothetical protein
MTPPDINRIVAADVVADGTLELRFCDGYVASLCLTPQLWGPVFEPLKDPNYFRQVQVEDGTVRWPNGADFCPDVLRFWCEAGGVRTQEETDVYFSGASEARMAS